MLVGVLAQKEQKISHAPKFPMFHRRPWKSLYQEAQPLITFVEGVVMNDSML